MQPEDPSARSSSEGHSDYQKDYPLDSKEAEHHHKLAQLKPYVSNPKELPQPDPTYRETHETFESLQEHFQTSNINEIIKALYIRQAQQQSQEKSSSQPKISHWKQLKEDNELSRRRWRKRRYYMRESVKSQTLASKEKQYRFRQKQIMAKAFCQRGYGIAYLQKQVVESQSQIIIDRQLYQHLINSILTSSYRMLEHFLLNECKKSITPINSYEMKSLYVTLGRCRTKLPEEQIQTLFKFIRLTYGIDHAAVSEEMALKLYITLQEEVRSKIGVYQLNCSEDKERYFRYRRCRKMEELTDHNDFAVFFDSKRQIQLVEVYLQHQDARTIQKHFIEKYPHKKPILLLARLKNKLTNITRTIIRKIPTIATAYPHSHFPTLVQMDQEAKTYLAKYTDGTMLRLEILDFFFRPSRTKIVSRFRKIIERINRYITEKKQKRQNMIIEKKDEPEHVVDKVDRNILAGKDSQERKISQGQELLLKGKQRNYQHFLNNENGNTLHFYRKIEGEPVSTIDDISELKIEEQAEYLEGEEQEKELFEVIMRQFQNWTAKRKDFEEDELSAPEIEMRAYLEQLMIDFQSI